MPGLYGYVSATKWLKELELTTLEAFDGYWVPLGWAKLGADPDPVADRHAARRPGRGRARCRSPGSPGRRIVASSRVEVGVDGVWADARLSTPISDATWVQWVFNWAATPGHHVVQVRATDGTGAVQTEQATPPAPDGARGWDGVAFDVS